LEIIVSTLLIYCYTTGSTSGDIAEQQGNLGEFALFSPAGKWIYYVRKLSGTGKGSI
jgi:hypothetical protein